MTSTFSLYLSILTSYSGHIFGIPGVINSSVSQLTLNYNTKFERLPFIYQLLEKYFFLLFNHDISIVFYNFDSGQIITIEWVWIYSTSYLFFTLALLFALYQFFFLFLPIYNNLRHRYIPTLKKLFFGNISTTKSTVLIIDL